MTSARTVLAVDPLAEKRFGTSLATRDASLQSLGPDLDPFLMVSLYSMRRSTFPPHPHAGFMVATYILPESDIGFVNQDSLGTRNRIAPGSLHVTVAGRGVLHEEQPEVEGRLAQGYQIWIDLPDAHREVAPRALHLTVDEVPRVASPGVDVRVVLGTAGDIRSPLELPTAVALLDVRLTAGARWAFPLPLTDHAFAFVLDGLLEAGGRSAGVGQLLRTRADGDLLALSAGTEGARFTLFAGTPMAQSRVMQGPFVASNAAQLARFTHAYSNGRFGSLQPFGHS